MFEKISEIHIRDRCSVLFQHAISQKYTIILVAIDGMFIAAGVWNVGLVVLAVSVVVYHDQ